jgi:uncharacterized repeat protein (TIGR04138 family)
MIDQEFNAIIHQVLNKDPRYAKGAYHFIRKALNHTSQKIQRRTKQTGPLDVPIPKLIQGLCEYAHDQFGPMACCVFRHWGVSNGEDFGHIVFNLVEQGAFSKSEADAHEAFKAMPDFKEVLESPYLPAAKRPSHIPGLKRMRRRRTPSLS